MEKIKIITDSTADLSKSIIDRYQIEVLPLLVNFNNNTYKDGVDVNLIELLAFIDISHTFPTTSQVNPQRFMECYKSYLSDGYKIVSLHLSSKLSGTYQSACIAKSMLESEDIIVIDAQNVTSGLGLLVLKACRLKEEGFSIREIEKAIIEMIPHIKSVLAFETLDNLVKGGRLSKTAGLIGNILGIKPILAVENGEMIVVDRVRGSKKAIRFILEHCNKAEKKKGEPCILLHVENKDILDSLRKNLLADDVEFIECEVGCVVGTYAGAGACGIFYIEDY